jgi:NAD(P)-dependent dehydrogenase (short-subunit alcohol dehydrogenase family)
MRAFARKSHTKRTAEQTCITKESFARGQLHEDVGMRRRLEGQVAVVLGASAEGGSGWAIAEELSREGCKVVVAARREAPLRELARRIGGTFQVCDACREEQIAELAATAIRNYGRLNIAVNAAGEPFRGPIAELTRERLQEALDLNYFGCVYFVKHMAAAIGTDGAIVLISSMCATNPVQGFAAYGCAKAATSSLVRYAALEYGKRNIRINAVLPGPIESAASQGLFLNAEIRGAFEKEIPLGRIAQPEDIAQAVMWLASLTLITGVNLQLNGGNFLQRFPRAEELPGGSRAFESRPLKPAAG